MAIPVLLFASGELANRPVAGIPAAARALHAYTQRGDIADGAAIQIAAPVGWKPSAWCADEIERLVPNLIVDTVSLPSQPAHAELRLFDAVAVLDGEGAAASLVISLGEWSAGLSGLGQQAADLDRIGARIVKSTGKPSDGMVSRYVNRPVSRAMSRTLLRFRGIRPIHATALAAFVGILMALCLLFGGEGGLIAGALLFHAASVIDGVDGEIARATFRSSKFGAKLDTIIDGITNLAFLSFASLNLLWRDQIDAATYGATGLGLLAIGLTALSLRSRALGGAFTFDVVKNRFRAKGSAFFSLIAALTSRDVYAAVFAITFAIGFAGEALLVFAVAAAAWLATVLWVLARTPTPNS